MIAHTQEDSVQDAVEELTTRGAIRRPWAMSIALSFFSVDQRADFYKELAVLVDRQVRLPEALATLYAVETGGQAEADGIQIGRPTASPLGVLIPKWLHDVKVTGRAWDETLADGLPAREGQMLRAFYRAGLTGDHLRHMALSIQRVQDWRRQMRNSLIPIGIAAVAMILAIYGGSLFLLPDLFRAMPGIRLHGAAADLKAMCDIVAAYGHFGLVAFVLLATGVWWSLDHLTGPLRRWLDRIPLLPWALYRQWTGANWLESMSVLIGAETQVPEALDLLCRDASPYVAERLHAVLAQDDARLGLALSRTGFEWPDTRIIRAMRIYLSGDRPHEGLAALSEEQLERLSARMLAAAGIISYGGTLVIGLFMGWTLYASFDLYQSVMSGLGGLGGSRL